jgi:hypothetical protein
MSLDRNSSIASEPSDSRSVSLDCQLYLGLAKEPDALVSFHHTVITLQRTKTYKRKNNVILLVWLWMLNILAFRSDKRNINNKYKILFRY